MQKPTAPKRRALLQTIKTQYTLQIASVDVLGLFLETEDGCKYVMVAVDCSTHWVEVYAIRNQEATTVIKQFVDELLCRFSQTAHSDQGTSLSQNC